jgi:hypothetical protein
MYGLFLYGGITLKITESITANVSMEDVKQMIRENALKEGYDVVKISPEYKKNYSPDPRDSGLVTGYDVTGFKVDLKRKDTYTPRLGGSNVYNDR